ncbi:hypothetical protein PsYK624_116120 [Phanerochaete sordida]|uniref:Uncharacterized protein n=1 Tax=Phanerochaete sordida TaxID=48140 RepID=A0A9P3LHW2_9APHY|nr:hypothetical protein PsYK624_116120 [Phanerochaete sordida]
MHVEAHVRRAAIRGGHLHEGGWRSALSAVRRAEHAEAAWEERTWRWPAQNPSPFMSRHTAVLHPPQLMDGVRRWISSGLPTSRKNTHIEPWDAPLSTASKAELKPDLTSTEFIAVALLDASVPAEEEAEYGAYVAQCTQLSPAPHESAARKDQRKYDAPITLATSTADPDAAVDIYALYVKRARSFV